MSLKVSVRNAINLPNKDAVGKSDPYVTVIFQGEKKKTEVKNGTLDPVWNEELTWKIGSKPPRPDEALEIIVKDYERIGWNKLIGKTAIPLRNILHGTTGTLELEQTLLDDNDQATTGKISLSLLYEPPLKGSATSVASANIGKAAGGNQTSTEEGTDAFLATPDDMDGVAHIPKGTPTVGVSSANRTREGMSNVTTKFQIRVRVVEARQLLGEDLSPVCRVSFKSKIQQTRIHKSTISPWFDQLFYFHDEEYPKEFMQEYIEFKVCNSRLLRSSSVIGAFKCEVSQIYDQENHAITNKWLVLAHPDEPTPTVQGYLKVSIVVMGPGDVCPSIEPSVDDKDDVEANLLWSAGVHLQPASFNLSVYCAENLPRMDSGTMQSLKEALGFGKASKELVDPFLIANYAGKEVQTRIHYTNDSPEFRQQLHLGFLFPSMCNSLKLTLMDWDRASADDVIGKAVIPISSISAPGEDGYLPTFGPCYVPVYGARREWELWDGKEKTQMNEGIEEGCSYRGRVLVSLETNVGNYPTVPTTDMDDSSFNKVRTFRSTRNFVLCAHFTHAYLLKEANRALEVEVSIGNFGNKLEQSILPSPSSTHPSNPVFDGCRYYFLPWGDSSPLIMVQCQWEDITYRLMASNAVSKISKTTRKNLRSIKQLMKSGKEEEGVKARSLCQESLKTLISSCRNPLPEPDPIRHALTPLDTALSKRRSLTLKKIGKEALGLMNESAEVIVEELRIVINKLEDLAYEPQNSIPDIFLWLMSGTERLAFARIPAQKVLFAFESDWSGEIAGHFTTFPMKYPEDISGLQVGGVVRASLWFGREEDLRQWWDVRGDLQLAVYAETFENQVVSAPGTGKWSNKGALMRRPPFSDADGFKELPKDMFVPSIGWKFQGDWFIDPDPSIKYSMDSGHTVYCEEVFEQQARVPGGTWLDAPNTWTDARGDPATPREQIECPVGWQWRDLWATDLQRAVDCEGWEYTVQKGITGWSPQEKLYHILRRRRWMRERHRVGKVEKVFASKDGWEYATLFSRRFHARERGIDIVRRRRWRRKLVPAEQGIPATPRIMVMTDNKDVKDSVVQITCPRQYVVSTEVHSYQLRAHIYQARDLAAGDKSGLSDPYAVISFCGSTQQTEKQGQTLCPTWDQTLVFDEIRISGPIIPPNERCSPPSVVVEIYDWDHRGEPDFLGRVICEPHAIDLEVGYKPPKLQWYQIVRGGVNYGEILAAFELFLKDPIDLPMHPPSKGDTFMLPFGIRPVLQKTRIEVLCWGIRNMLTYELQSVTRPSIEFECGGQEVKSSIMMNSRQNPNFDNPHLSFDVELPKEELYMPPLTLRVFDHRSFGSKPMVASSVVSNLHKYTVEPKTARKRAVIVHSQSIISRGKSHDKHDTRSSQLSLLSSTLSSKEPGVIDSQIDWWSKYYASANDLVKCGNYLKKGYERLEVINGHLEDDRRFNNFTDLIDSVSLYRGRSTSSSPPVGEFKGTFRVYPINNENERPPMVLAGFPSPDPQEVVLRIYVVKATDLAPKDSGSSSDPYVTVAFGKQRKSGKDSYKAGTLNPIFGSMFEVKGRLPLVKDLIIQVWDKDRFSSDDIIGETVIDIENRYLSRFRSSVGLQKQYHVSGPNMWRDHELPSQILDQISRLHNMDGPYWNDHPLSARLDGSSYTLNEFEPKETLLPPTLGAEKERLALYILHTAFTLVPEHVESRTLYHKERPGLPQGTLELWVDIFPAGIVLPPPVEITPRRPSKYVLRVCLYNVYDVPLQESNFAGEKMSDIYIKGWLQGTDNVQKTDIHYRSLDGEGNFNWRFVFHFDYMEAEQTMIVTKKTSIFSSEKSEQSRPPQLTLQLWDNDLILSDDYLSETTLDLCHFPKPAKSLGRTSLVDIFPKSRTENATTVLMLTEEKEPVYINLFEVRRVYGYLPFIKVGKSGNHELGGKLEAEIEVLPEEEAMARPAGQGRDEPNANPNLPEPKRPATSFLWLSSPWKSFRHILWKNYKWYIITFFILLLLLIFLLVILYTLPEASVYYMLGAY